MISKSTIVVTVNIKKIQLTTFNYPEQNKSKKTKQNTKLKWSTCCKSPPKAVPVKKTGSQSMVHKS